MKNDMSGNLKRTFFRQDGAALIMALGVIMIMMITGALLVNITTNRDKTLSYDKQLTQSGGIAQAGVDEAISVTVGNYATIYHAGVPSADTAGDGDQLFADKPLKDNNGVTRGIYSVWTKADPERPGNVLITAEGRDGAPNPETSTVRVSVKYMNNFDYALFTGAPASPSVTTFNAQSRGDDHDDCDHDDNDDNCGSNIHVNGRVMVNGNMVISSLREGHNDHDHYDDVNTGIVTFEPRSGYADPVNYSGTFSGSRPTGTQPARTATVLFPTVDFSRFTDSILGSGSVKTVNLPSSGVPTGGWTRNSSVFTISADNFQTLYGDQGFEVVQLTSAQSDVTVQIVGACDSKAITSTIMVMGASGSTTKIKELDIIGPVVSMQPANGIAIISREGKVSLQGEVLIGSNGHGVLVYLSGAYGATPFEVTGDLVLYGSVVVNGQVDFSARGGGEHHDDDDDDHDGHDDDGNHEYHGSTYCGNEDHNEGHTMNIAMHYDPAWLTNATLLGVNWWSWTGTGGYTAIKENFERVR